MLVVSACYAGVFLDELKTDTTAIITAADAAHSSFGCDDDRDLTWFGEAFLKDSLPASPSLEEAFTKGRGADRRAARRPQHEVHSNPQLYIGPLMRRKLAELPVAAPDRHSLTRAAVSTIPSMRKNRSAQRRRAGAAQPPAVAPLSVVILAAGEGKRMKSALPKVLQPLAGRPLLKHVIDTARAAHARCHSGGLRARRRCGARGTQRTSRCPGRCRPSAWAPDTRCAQAMPHIPDDHRVLVLYGDVPLISAGTLRELLALAGEQRLALLTMRTESPDGYGRIVRNARGLVQRIVEQSDASRRELAIRECNYRGAGVPGAAAAALAHALSNPDNAQGEYYLTDVIAMAVKEKIAVQPLLGAARPRSAGRQRQGAAGRAGGAVARSARRASCCSPASRSPIPRASTCAARSRTAATCSSTSTWCSRAR